MKFLGTFTIELDDKKHFEIGSTYEPSASYSWSSVDDLVDYIRARRGVWYGHEVAGHAMLTVAESLRRRGIKFAANERDGGLTRIVAGATLADFHGVFPLPLSTIRGMVGAQDESDARVLYEGIVHLGAFCASAGLDLRSSLGSTAWRSAAAELGLPKCDLDFGSWDFGHRAYLGGRLAIVRPTAVGPGVHYDLVNAYPSALRQPLPVGEHRQFGTKRATQAFANERPGLYRARVSVPEDMFLPPLPFRYGKDQVAFPVGEFSGIWTQPELAFAVACGVTVERISDAVVWEDTAVIFADLMDRWYAVRRKAGKSSPEGQWVSRLMKALCGTFAMGMDHERVVVNPDDEDIKWCNHEHPCTRKPLVCTRACGAWRPIDVAGAIWGKPYRYFPESGFVHWAAYLTSYTRVDWLVQAMRLQGSVAYGNTDSLWLIGRRKPTPIGEGLGHWKREHGWGSLKVRAPNRYEYDDELGKRVLVGGVPRPMMRFEQAAAKGKGLARATGDHRSPQPMPELWYGDRLLDSTHGVTYPPTIDQLEARTHGKASETE